MLGGLLVLAGQSSTLAPDFLTEFILYALVVTDVAMLAALNRGPELKLHINGALNNGLTKEEIKEIFIQVAIYCGIPASLDAFKTASGVFKDRGI